MDMTGFPDGEPTRVGVAITDYLAGLYAVQGILLALDRSADERPRTARRHRAVRRDAVGDAAAAVGAARHWPDPDPGRQRSPEHRALRAAAREGRPHHRGGREPRLVGPFLRRHRPPGSPRRSALHDEHAARRPIAPRSRRRSKPSFEQFTVEELDRAPAGGERAVRPRAIDPRSDRASAGRGARHSSCSTAGRTVETLGRS